MERRKRSITCISLSPSNTICTHSLSFTLMAKLTRRRRKHKTTKTPRNKITTTPKTLDISLKNPQRGLFIGTRGKEASGTTPGPRHWRDRASTAAKTRPEPHFCGCTRTARAVPPAARCRFGPLSVGSSGFLI